MRLEHLLSGAEEEADKSPRGRPRHAGPAISPEGLDGKSWEAIEKRGEQGTHGQESRAHQTPEIMKSAATHSGEGASLTPHSGGLAQLARAPALQAGGQRFESVILHKIDH